MQHGLRRRGSTNVSPRRPCYFAVGANAGDDFLADVAALGVADGARLQAAFGREMISREVHTEPWDGASTRAFSNAGIWHCGAVVANGRASIHGIDGDEQIKPTVPSRGWWTM